LIRASTISGREFIIAMSPANVTYLFGWECRGRVNRLKAKLQHRRAFSGIFGWEGSWMLGFVFFGTLRNRFPVRPEVSKG
jgi:hypothetical protein